MGRPLLRDEVPVGVCKVRALYSWSGESPQDLGFVEGDIIEVLNNGDGDWWTGKLKRNKQVGVFPRNFAEYVDPEQETISAALSKSPPRKKTALGQFQLETSPIDFTTVSLSDLAISDPQDGEEPSLVLGSQHRKSQDKVEHTLSHSRGRASVSRLDPGSPLSTASLSQFGPTLDSISKLESFTNSRFESTLDSGSHLDPGPQSIAKSPLTTISPSNVTSPKLGASSRSTKSAQDILDEISHELNQQFLDDINLDAHTEDFLVDSSSKPPVPPPHRSLHSSTNSMSHSKRNDDPSHNRSRSQSLVPEVAVFNEQQAKQQQFQQQLQPKSSALTGPVIDYGNRPASGMSILSSTGKAASKKEFSSDDQLSDHPQDASSLGIPDGLLADQRHSPLLDHEISFDPKAFKPERSVGDHIGSHFDTGYSSQIPANADEDSEPVPTATGAISAPPIVSNSPKKSVTALGSTLGQSAAKLTKSGAKATNSPSTSSTHGQESTSTYIPPKEHKLNFFQRLLPKNSQRLLRKTSRSSLKSSRSNKLTGPIASKLRTVKSMFSFSPDFEPDDAIYPSNMETISKPAPPIAPHPPLTSASLSASHGPSASISTNRGSGVTKHGSALSFGASTSSPLANLTKNAALSNTNSNNKDVTGGKWIESRRDLYRAQTLTERDLKKRRQDLELQGINCDNIVENLDLESGADFHDYRLECFEEVDQAVLNMSTWPQLMTPGVFASSRIGRHFSDPVERLRAVFLLCTTRIQHVETTPVHNNVMQSRQATAKELAQTVVAMCSALDIECEAVEGHIRHVVGAQATNITSTPHWWNAVKINEEWRLLDVVTAASPSSAPVPVQGGASPGLSEVDSDFVNLFYFLTPPAQLIFTHVPDNHQKQFLHTTIPTATAAILPLAAPATFAHNISFDQFWLGATRLADLEVSELHLRVPDTNEDLVAFVNGKPALAQAFYRGTSERLFRVKAFVPPHTRQALLQIYAVPKDQPSRDPANLELMWTVELRHTSGDKHNTAFDFVVRHAAPTVKDHDLYVLEPQCWGLSGGDTYKFVVENFSKKGSSGVHHKHLKQPQLAVQSPSGRLTRMVPLGTDVNDTFRASVKTMEVGTWRAVARQNENLGWVPFAEWFCS